VYHEDVDSTPSGKPPRTPFTRTFTTFESEVPLEGGVQAYAGTIEGGGDLRTSPESQNQRVARMLFESARKQSTQLLTPEKFGELWGHMERAEVFQLPPYKGDEPPPGRSYFIVESGNPPHRRTIYLRPPKPPRRADDEPNRTFERWTYARLAALTFVNEPQWDSR
jgi:hypothetical protein